MALDFSLITEHPWATAGIVALGGVGLYLYWNSGSSSSGDSSTSGGATTGGPTYTTQAADPAATQANTALGIAQLQANAQTNQFSAALAAQAQQLQASVDINGSNNTANTNQLTAQLEASTKIAAGSQQVQTLGITTQGQLGMAQIAAALAIAELQAKTGAVSAPTTTVTPTVTTPVATLTPTVTALVIPSNTNGIPTGATSTNIIGGNIPGSAAAINYQAATNPNWTAGSGPISGNHPLVAYGQQFDMYGNPTTNLGGGPRTT